MEITLTPEFEQLVQDQVASGHYPSPTEVVEAGLRLFRQHDPQYEKWRADIQAKLDHAAAQMENGEYTVYSSAEEMMADIEAQGLELLAKRQATKP